ncbi:fungal-specific transcription factor domain-containing protein [Aspergillus avenaceus]|uniref:Fungal-specific transcription factor domain-containing protein n=1 Tax=Aspergillus avenaceus TaxID=36643 RepID=A0A5N6TKW0_ASPAV|nr:fungal-specific transcription factor domain-containing protein [Aspergillus avenaceus]
MEASGSRSSKRRCVKDRVRVTRACDACKRKKLRCSGTRPCALCQRSGLNCEYTAGYTRGKLPPIPSLPQTGEDSNNVARRNPQSSSYSNIDRLPLTSGMAIEAQSLSRIDKDASNLPSHDSPEPHQTDMEGHYVGPSSGVSFLIRVQKRLHESMAVHLNTPIFSFGDAPLLKYDPSFLVLPRKSDAEALVSRYFDFAFPTHRFLHQQQVEGWLEDLYTQAHASDSPEPGEREIKALLLMIFIQAAQYPTESGSPVGASVNRAVYFGASEHHLAAETGPVRITSVQARLAQCFHLISESRINHCWNLFGTTARLAIALGLHRKRRRDQMSAVNLVEHECCKRVFWCAYSLDNYLSAALGRPRVFHDEDIDQELPEIADDYQITQTVILPATSSSQSLMLAPVYHAKLSKIISGILHDLYGIRKLTLEALLSTAERYANRMREWRKELSPFLDIPSVHLLMITYQRQYTVLNLAFYHAHILLYRPFVLKSLTPLKDRGGNRDGSLYVMAEQNIQSCLEAAMKIVSIVHNLCENGRMYRAFWFTHYYAFSAIAVLYFHYIRKCSRQSNNETNIAYYKAGEQGQNDLATCGSQASFAERYVMVLEELRKEAHKATRRLQNGATEGISTPQLFLDRAEVDKNEVHRQSTRKGQNGCQLDNSFTTTFDPGLSSASDQIASHEMRLDSEDCIIGASQDTSPASYIAELASWGEFDSLATTGFGEFGNLLMFEGL